MPTPHLAVVVPAFNEEARLPSTLARIAEYLSGQDYTWSVTVVSDGSTDGTERIAREFASAHPGFGLIAYEQNRGKGHAVREGMLSCLGELLLFSDADLATPIEEVEKLLAALSRADVAIGSRPLRDSALEVRQPWYRELLGRAFNVLVQALAVQGVRDTQCGFKLFRAEAARQIFRRCKIEGFGFDFEALMVARDLGYRIAEVPIRWRHQEGSKVVLARDGPRMLADLVRLRLAGRKGRMALRAE